MNEPLVSLLIRSLDRDTLAQTLASALAQDHRALEVWVVAAVPGHAPLALPEGADNVHLVTTEQALHRSAAANKALDLARGTYVLFLDDDDWIAPEHISTLVRALQREPSFAVAYSRAQTVEAQQGRWVTEGLPVLGLPFDGLRLLAGNWMPPHAVLFSRHLCDLGCRVDEQIDLFEDWDFWLQAAQHTDFLYVPVTTAFYRIHNSSGVHEQARFVGDAWRTIYAKWRPRWRPDQLAQLMARSWEHGDLTHNLQASQALAQHLTSDLQASQTKTQQLTSDLQASQARAAQLLADVSALQANERVLLQTQQSLERSHAAVMQEIRNSRSWRLTAPLRKAGAVARRVRETARAVLRLVRKPGVLLQRVPALLRQQGVRALWQRVEHEKMGQPSAYLDWVQKNEPAPDRYAVLGAQMIQWRQRPLISVLMPTYNSPLPYLQEAVDSVRNQLYPHWQLCIADDASTRPEVRTYLQTLAAQDARVVLALRKQNGHISACSNTALELAQGEWVALLDHDDRLHPLALFHVVRALQRHPDANLIYSDEDKIDASGVRFGPYFKCDYNRELMWAQNMISHLGCYRRSVLQDIEGFRVGLEGSQDYDLALRVIERSRPEQIVHVPHVLYHWRAIVGSTALSADQKPYADSASRRALQAHLERIGLAAVVEPAPELPTMNRVRPALPTPLPLVSVLIPTRDRIDLLKTCVESLRERSTYPQMEIIVIDNGSVEAESLRYFEALRQQGVQVMRDDGPFNFSALNNRAAQQAKGEFVCLMNNDIEILSPHWLEEMLSFAALPGVGAVGACLWYPNEQGLQHGGVIIGIGGVAGHANLKMPRGGTGYFSRAVLHHRLLAVTAACLLIRKSHFMAVGGLDEQLPVAFNDVDFCLRLHQAGWACIYTPYAEMVHHESASRGDDMSDANRERFMRDQRFMHERWGDSLKKDPFFSPNLSLQHSDFRMAEQSRAEPLL